MGEAHPVRLRAGPALTAGLCGLQQGEAVTCQAHPRGGSIPSFQALWETQYNLLPPEGGSEYPLKDGCSAAQSCPSLGDPRTVACKALLSMGLSRQEYWNGSQFPPPGGIFPTQGLNPGLPHCRQILYHLWVGAIKSFPLSLP